MKKIIKKKIKKVSKRGTKTKVRVTKKISSKVAKNTPNKKVNKIKTKSNKALVVAFGDQCFWIKDGPILKDLVELRDALYNITKDQFEYHVSETKNDFAEWVKYVLNEDRVSSVIRKSKTAKSLLSAIEKSLQKYNH